MIYGKCVPTILMLGIIWPNPAFAAVPAARGGIQPHCPRTRGGTRTSLGAVSKRNKAE